MSKSVPSTTIDGEGASIAGEWVSPTARSPRTVMVAAAFAAFLATFNETFLNVAFAPIMADFGVGVSTVQWLATAYMLGAAVMVPVSAFAYRSIPTRPLFCTTVALLVIGSVIGAFAPDFTILLVGRIVQALGTGMLIPIGMNITLEAAPREKLGSYMGIMGAMTTLGPSSSVIAAGLLLAAFDWRVLLWVFAGLSLLCFLFGAAMLGNIAKLTKPRLDALSVALVGIALIGILYGVSTVFTGSLVLAVVAAAVGAVSLMLFVRRQRTLEQPLIDLRPLSVAPFTMGVVVNMIALISIFAMNIIIPTFLQSVLGMSSLVASLALFPAILLSCVVSPLAGRIYDRHGSSILVPLGCMLIAVFAAALSRFIATGSIVLIAALYIPVICGSALIIGPVQSFSLSKLDPELNPHGVTVMSTGFQIAGCVGSSLFTGVYAAVLAGAAVAGAGEVDAAAQGFLAAGLLTSVFALAGFVVALKLRAHATTKAEAFAVKPATVGPLLACIMKTDVYTVHCESPVSEALRLFIDKGVSGVPVVDTSGGLVGFVSDGDVMSFLSNQTATFKSAYSFIVEQGNGQFDAKLQELLRRPVGDIATKRVIGVNLHTEMGEVCKVLAEHHLKKAPVLDDGRMVGIVNRSNITRYAVRSYLEGGSHDAACMTDAVSALS